MEYIQITKDDYALFHELANAYYREGEDAQTPQEEVDFFIRLLFDKVMNREIEGCFAKAEGEIIGFSLWAVDTGDFDFSEMPGYGTILEIGLIQSRRVSGHGKELVSYIEDRFRRKNITHCYVTAYGLAEKFWARCGYAPNGKKASNGLPIMVKDIGQAKTKRFNNSLRENHTEEQL